jgi:nucleoside-diphosphate-sugar epimerase
VRGWRVAQKMIEDFARGDKVVRYPDFSGPIDWTYVDDAAEVLLRAVERPLPHLTVLNVLGDKRTMRDAVVHLQRRFPGVTAEAIPAETPPTAWGLRNDGLAAALGYVPATSLEDGIDAMLAVIPAGRSQ